MDVYDGYRSSAYFCEIQIHSLTLMQQCVYSEVFVDYCLLFCEPSDAVASFVAFARIPYKLLKSALLTALAMAFLSKERLIFLVLIALDFCWHFLTEGLRAK
ncbi:hypothetical protein ACTXT7_001276 [Hymenolepis weldensis]